MLHADYNATIGDIHFVIHRQNTAESQRGAMVYPYWVLALAVAGRASYQWDQGKMKIEAGQLILIPPYVRRSIVNDPQTPWQFYAVAFDLISHDPSSAEAFSALPRSCRPDDSSEIEALFAELDRHWSAAASGHLLRCRGLIYHLMYCYVRTITWKHRAVPHAQKLQHVVDFLQHNYTQTYRVEELADMAILSESRFRTLFKKFTGTSVVNYQNRIRVNRAKGLLMSGEATVTRAALQVGFKDVYYFSRIFKKIAGVTPSSIRTLASPQEIDERSCPAVAD